MPESFGDTQKYLSQPSKEATHVGLLPLFDKSTGLPAKDLLPELLDSFYDYYADNYFFLANRRHLESLIEQGKASVFLICVMSALSSRFCSPNTFARYIPLTKSNGTARKAWEFSTPFLEQAKFLMISALDLPSPDIVAGLLMLAFVDFGNNNEAGTTSYHYKPCLV